MQNTSYILKTSGSEVLFIPHFYSPLIKISTFVDTNHLDTLQVFGEMIWLSQFPVSGSGFEDVILLHLYLQMLNN